MLTLPIIPEESRVSGFVLTPIGTHTSKTMMLAELSRLIAASPQDADYEDLRRLIVEDNVTLKDSLAARKDTFNRLAQLYALRSDRPIYRALRELWPTSIEEQPVMAILCALARDPLLRATAPIVIDAELETAMTPQMLEGAVDAAYPGRYSERVRASVGRNTISSWRQSGHLAGHLKKYRSRAAIGPASVAYALFLGYLCGDRGVALLDTFWAQVLDSTPSTLDGLAFAAYQRGWIGYRRIGDVAEIDFQFLMHL
jgi:hypothetical protein